MRTYRVIGLGVFACLTLSLPAMAQDRVAGLIENLKSKDATVRLAALRLMSELAQTSRSQYVAQAEQTVAALRAAGPEIALLVSDPDPRVRVAAAEALGRTRATGVVAGQAWSEALRDRSVLVRRSAAEAVGLHALAAADEARAQFGLAERVFGMQKIAELRKFVEDAPALLKPLEPALRDADAGVRSAGLQSLIQLLNTLVSVGQIADTDVAGAAQQATHDALKKGLQPLALGLESLIPVLTENVRSGGTAQMVEAARALEELARLSQPLPARPSNRGSLTSPVLQPEGQGAADLLQRSLRKVVPDVVTALKSQSEEVQLAGMELFEAMGAEASAALPDVLRAATDDSPFVRWAAARTLGKIGRPDADVIRTLGRLLKDEDADVRSAASLALGQFGERAATAVADLSRAVADGDADLQANAIRALKAIGPVAKEAVPALRKALRSPEVRVRRAAAELLGEIGPSAQTAVPGLEALLNDPEPDVRQAAGRALISILMPK